MTSEFSSDTEILLSMGGSISYLKLNDPAEIGPTLPALSLILFCATEIEISLFPSISPQTSL